MAGIAFSKSYVGYVHAIAHSLGGQYDIPHGLVNAVLLLVVLEEYGPCAHEKLYEMAVTAGVANYTDTYSEAAQKFVVLIRNMNKEMNIPTAFSKIRKADIPIMARHAAMEANPLYPVPRVMDRKELSRLYEMVSTDGRTPEQGKQHLAGGE